jgi:hypothetical protein
VTVDNRSYHESNGLSYRTHGVAINHGSNNSTVTNTTIWPDGSIQIEKSTAAMTRLQPPPM